MDSSTSKWIFQTALLLCSLIMMTEGIKCYQCIAADLTSCIKGTPDQLKECDCQTKVLVDVKGQNSEKKYSNEGCEKDTDKPVWKGCYSGHLEYKSGEIEVKLSRLGCATEKLIKCEEEEKEEEGHIQRKYKYCYCDKEGCNLELGSGPGGPAGNSTGNSGEKLAPKSSHLFIFQLILGGIVLQMILD